MRNLGEVLLEVDHYRDKHRLDMIVFNDNTLNINKPRWMKICAGMKTRGSWAAAIRCAPFDEDMARAAKISGCKYLVVGVESFDQAKLDRMNKKIKVRSIVRTLDLLHKYDIDYHGNILFGFEDETLADINQEWATVPDKYKVFPAMVQNFVGTQDGADRAIDKYEYAKTCAKFANYVKLHDKYVYPEAV